MIGMVQVNNYKFDIVEEIKRIIAPHLWESGYVKHDTNDHIKLYVFGKDENDEDIRFENEDVSLSIEGFTEDGVIIDSFMCIATTNFEDLMLEQLLFAYGVAKKIEE